MGAVSVIYVGFKCHNVYADEDTSFRIVKQDSNLIPPKMKPTKRKEFVQKISNNH